MCCSIIWEARCIFGLDAQYSEICTAVLVINIDLIQRRKRHIDSAIEYVKDMTADFGDIVIHYCECFITIYGTEKDYLVSNLLHPITLKSV
jgi:hypothetical protein